MSEQNRSLVDHAGLVIPEVDAATDRVEELGRLVHREYTARGWNLDSRTFVEDLALVMTELAEAVEDYRNGANPPEMWRDESGKPVGPAIEVADVIIRVLNMCAHWDIPIASALNVKIAYNATRPHRHGGKRL